MIITLCISKSPLSSIFKEARLEKSMKRKHLGSQLYFPIFFPFFSFLIFTCNKEYLYVARQGRKMKNRQEGENKPKWIILPFYFYRKGLKVLRDWNLIYI